MDKFTGFIDVLRDYTGRDSDTVVVDTAKPLGKLMEELNTQNQMFQGVSGQGVPIVPAYRAYTVRIKRMKGQPSNRVTLRDTGDFHRSVRAVFKDDEITMTATDPKTSDLEDKYGPDILGLNDASLSTVKDKLKPLLINSLRKDLSNV